MRGPEESCSMTQVDTPGREYEAEPHLVECCTSYINLVALKIYAGFVFWLPMISITHSSCRIHPINASLVPIRSAVEQMVKTISTCYSHGMLFALHSQDSPPFIIDHWNPLPFPLHTNLQNLERKYVA